MLYLILGIIVIVIVIFRHVAHVNIELVIRFHAIWNRNLQLLAIRRGDV